MKVLVVEDETRLASAIERGLRDRGFEVAVAHDGHTGYHLAKDTALDVIVLDLMLPGLSGEEVCRRLRQEGFWTPILALTAKDRESDETDALDLGADDYVRKPFSFPVLVARCRALARRGPAAMPAELRVGDLVVDPRRRTVRVGEQPLALTPREFALLEYLVRHVGRVLSKEEILTAVWGDTPDRDANVVEVYVGYLRRKIDQPHGTNLVTTVRGQGYLIAESA
ncbi:MAG TPA: response regulator transcription factor [Nocardioidaceae bacterium]|nr:response regulator transcription factor [Nocardioidaceae bacterium]